MESADSNPPNLVISVGMVVVVVVYFVVYFVDFVKDATGGLFGVFLCTISYICTEISYNSRVRFNFGFWVLVVMYPPIWLHIVAFSFEAC